MSHREERIGEGMLLAVAMLEGLYPILAHDASHVFPPFFFIGVNALTAGGVFLLILTLRGEARMALPPVLLRYVLLIVGFTMVAFVLVQVGTRLSSGISTALLVQTETVFAFLVATFLLHEKLTRSQLHGALALFAGTILVLYNGTFAINVGDLIILFAVFLYPFGNFFTKRALALASPVTVLLLRYVFAAALFLPASILFEDAGGAVTSWTPEKLWLLGAASLLIFTLSKVLWYGGLKRLDLGRATYLISARPVAGLLFAYLLLREVPTVYQLAGCVLAVMGVILMTVRPSRSIEID